MEAELTEEGERWGDDVFTATKWELLELSSAPVPANGRAYSFSLVGQTDEDLSSILSEARKKFEENKTIEDKIEQVMTEEPTEEPEEPEELADKTKAIEDAMAGLDPANIAKESATVPGEETVTQTYVQEIISLGEKYNQPTSALEALNSGMTLEEYKDKLLSIQFNSKPVVDRTQLNEDSDDFNLARWIRYKSTPDSAELKRLSTYDIEYLDTFQTKFNDTERQIRGSLVPWQAFAGNGKATERNMFPPRQNFVNAPTATR